MRAPWKLLVGGAVIAAIAVDGSGTWMAAGPAALGQAAPAGRYAMATVQQAAITPIALPGQGSGLDAMGTKRRRRPG